MKPIITIFFSAFIAVFTQNAVARLEVSALPSTEPSQVGKSSKARIGVEAEARSSYTAGLTVAAGATLQCEESSLPITIQRPRDVSFPLPQATSLNVLVPASGEGQYEIAGFNTWVPGTPHLCNLSMKGAAVEAVTTITGAGVLFNFSQTFGGRPQEVIELRQFHMVRYPPDVPRQGPAGCYP